MSATFAIEIPVCDTTGLTLQGRLTVGEGKPTGPSVLILPGGGLSDGDGNDSDIGFAPLAQLAESLAEADIASLRFDRRGTGTSGGDYGGPDETAADLEAVWMTAIALPEFQAPRVIVGAGEAAVWAAILAAGEQNRDSDRNVAEGALPPADGIVLISPPAAPVGDLFRFGQRAELTLAGTPVEKHSEVLAELVREFDEAEPLLTFNPIFGVTCPTLILHGEMDWVCPIACSRRLVDEIERRGKGPPSLTYRELPRCDRWLMEADRWRTPAEQLEPHWRPNREAIAVLVNWLLELRPST